MSMTRRLIKEGIRGGSNPADLCSSLAHLVQFEPDEPSLSKGVNNAAHPPGGSPDETGNLTASSLPLFLV